MYIIGYIFLLIIIDNCILSESSIRRQYIIISISVLLDCKIGTGWAYIQHLPALQMSNDAMEIPDENRHVMFSSLL